MRDPITIRAVADREELDAAYRLRTEVWRAKGVSLAPVDSCWTDEHDEHAHHVVAVRGGQLLAAARVCVHDTLDLVPDAHVYQGLAATGRVSSINRLVVEPRARGLGLAQRLDDYRLEVARASGCTVVVANVLALTGTARVRSLEERGFLKLGTAFDRRLDERGNCLALYRRER